MNILQHIEANHYPRDDKGRALVPAPNVHYGPIVIVATDVPGRRPIAGWPSKTPGEEGVRYFTAEGINCHGCSDMNLLPPPPRKVTVKAYAIMEGGRCTRVEHADRFVRLCVRLNETVVELTGEYEEPWS